MSFRDDLDALAARHDALTTDVAERARELAETKALLDEAAARANRPILDSIRVATPCKASWDDMVGDDRVRHCAGCDKDVFNLSAMTRDEAEALIRERLGNLCGRYYRRANGTIITSDCTVGIAQRRRRRVMAAGLAAVLAGAGGLALVLSRRTQSGGGAAIATEVDEPTQIQSQTVGHEDAPPVARRIDPVVVPPLQAMPIQGDISLGAMELSE